MPTYADAGISDPKAFYAEKFAHEGRWDLARVPLARYDIRLAKIFWAYRHVPPGSRVLDFGCGSGTLALLKARQCTLVGVDLSAKALEIARTLNGYDEVFCGEIDAYDAPPHSFDCVASLDVFGHIPMEAKDGVIRRLKELLKPDGCMLHGIECGEVAYEGMTAEELAAFVEADGHIGIESRDAVLARFRRFFRHVEGEIRFCLENAADEYRKQAELYHLALDRELLAYLKLMTPDEERAFNVANGLVQLQMERLGLSVPGARGGFLYLRAADGPLPAPDFEAEPPRPVDRETLLADPELFFRGWYAVEHDAKGRPFRWGRNECLLRFRHLKRDVRLDISSPLPRLTGRPVTVYFTVYQSKAPILKVMLLDDLPQEVVLPTAEFAHLDLEVFTDACFRPADQMPGTSDHRALSLAVSGIGYAFGP